MPTVQLSKKALFSIIGKKVSDGVLKEKISMLGTDLQSVEGDIITVEVFPNRPDLLTEEGFGIALGAFLGVRPGLQTYRVVRSRKVLRVVKPLKAWPFAVAAVVKGIRFTDERLRSIIQSQEKLCTTLLRGRKKGGIGIYPLEKISFPVTFTSRPLEDIVFRPLDVQRPMNGKEILSRHPTGRKYGFILEGEERFPVFVDAEGVVMSMPPIINSEDVGRVSAKTRDVFVEVTGTSLHVLEQALNIMCVSLAEMGGDVHSVTLQYPSRSFCSPDFSPRSIPFRLGNAQKLLGVAFSAKEAKEALGKMGLALRGGRVYYPAWRADILHERDVIDELAIGFGYDRFEEVIPRVATIGEESRRERLRSVVRSVLVGLGLVEVKNFNLSSAQTQLVKPGVSLKLVTLRNALNKEFDVLRAWLLPSLLETLGRNLHHEFPQNLFEVGEVFRRANAGRGTGASVVEGERLGGVFCSEKATYTDARQAVDALARGLGLSFTYAPEKHAACIDGRAAKVACRGRRVGVVGEVRPEVLVAFGLLNPVSWFELDVEVLAQLVGLE
ncbi:phenylalanine--tRNA ligase subunit beta [Candidatus Woesearchaeota archaeon]|nr:MAG: phenylalanine--tRNA ligase subunit beta [Candidatus Woesearchaeota archaeon]